METQQPIKTWGSLVMIVVKLLKVLGGFAVSVHPNYADRVTHDEMRDLEEKYGGEALGPVPTIEEARAMAREDAVDAMGMARSRRGDADAYPAISIAHPTLDSSRFKERLWQTERDYWPDEVRDAYFSAFVLDLAAGDVALVERQTDGPALFYIVDLNVWEPASPDFRLGRVWHSQEPDLDWRPRSRWRRLRFWWKGRK